MQYYICNLYLKKYGFFTTTAIDICPALEKPKNGNLTCGTWELGNVCHMTCNEGYLVASDSSTDFDDVAVYNTVFVCGDDGYWSNNGSMPHCQGKKHSLFTEQFRQQFQSKTTLKKMVGAFLSTKDEIQCRYF